MTLGYLNRRLLQLAVTVIIAVSVNFLVPRLIPGGPAISGAYRARLGLNQPLWQQYVTYWSNLLRLDLGMSSMYPASVVQIIQGALPWTLGLLTTATLVAFGLGTLLGGLLAWPATPRVVRLLAPPLLILATVPSFLLAMVLVFLFVVELPVFPAGGPFDPLLIPRPNLATVLDILAHALLPALTLVLGSTGLWVVSMRATMVSVLGEDYIIFAEAKGLPPRRIFLWYGLRNALLPQVTSLGVALGSVLSGALLVEVIFGYPGLGGLLFRALIARDYLTVQGIALCLILALALVLFLVDLLYPLLDPRIRYAR